MLTSLRSLALTALVLLSSCTVLTEQDREHLSLLLENAANYYDSGDYERALQQWGSAREIDESNEKARLGEAYANYQLGTDRSPEGVRRLGQSEVMFADLRDSGIGENQWKADMGWGLVHAQWVELYDRRIALDTELQKAGKEVDLAEIEANRREKARHVVEAEEGFNAVLAGQRQDRVDRLTCLLSLARLAWHRGDLDGVLKYGREYETAVTRSKELWLDAMERFPNDSQVYEAKLFGAELKEAELRDLLANVLYELGRVDEALLEVDQVIAIQPKRASAYLNRGQIRESRELWDLAASDYRRFLTLTRLPQSNVEVLDASRRMLRCESEAERERQAEVEGEKPKLGPSPE